MTEMKELGIAVDNEGWQCVIQHYLVTGQLERAMDVYEERREKRERVGYNTYMDIMKELGRVGEVDEAIKVMGDFTAEWGSVGNNVIQPIAWYELLNITASNYHVGLLSGSDMWKAEGHLANDFPLDSFLEFNMSGKRPSRTHSTAPNRSTSTTDSVLKF